MSGVLALRGEIWEINLNPRRGREQKGIRPCLVVSTDGDLHDTAMNGWLRRYPDQSVSFTDAASFVVASGSRVTIIFTFARYFALAGYQVCSRGTLSGRALDP